MALSQDEFVKLISRLIVQKIKAQAPEQGSISRAFEGGKAQAKEGYEQARTATNPLELLRGGTKLAAGTINTALSPLAPITEPIGKGIEAVGEKIGDIPVVQEFAGTKTGEFVAGAAEDVGNLATIVGTGAGGKEKPQGGGKDNPATLKGAGGVLKSAGEKLYEVTITPEESTRMAMQSYQAKQPNLLGRIKNVIKGEGIEGKPITEAETAARKGLRGTEWKLGVQAKQVADDIWKTTIQPKLSKVKGEVNMKNFIGEVEKEIKKSGGDITRRRSLQEALDAIKEDYKNVGKINLEKLQDYKEGWAEFLPDATYKGKPIAGGLKEVHNLMAKKAREIIYKYVGEDGKQAYIDYGNLKSIQKSGIKSIKDPAAQSISRNIWQFLMDKAIAPVATTGGKILYKTGEGLEFIGNKGAKKVGDIINKQ